MLRGGVAAEAVPRSPKRELLRRFAARNDRFWERGDESPLSKAATCCRTPKTGKALPRPYPGTFCVFCGFSAAVETAPTACEVALRRLAAFQSNAVMSLRGGVAAEAVSRSCEGDCFAASRLAMTGDGHDGLVGAQRCCAQKIGRTPCASTRGFWHGGMIQE